MEDAPEPPRRQDGPLTGVPFVVKDNLACAGRPLTCGSPALQGHVAAFTATCVERLLEAGAVLVGRANMDAFAMGSTTTCSVHGPTRNPWDASRVAGGSSGGSAAAVAAGVVPLALGSDTGGSVRQPAALCGVVGFKPTWGRVSRRGLVAFASSLDTVGALSENVALAVAALRAMEGVDPGDPSTTWSREGRVPTPERRRPLRVGVLPPDLEDNVVREGVVMAAERLGRGGAHLVPVTPVWSHEEVLLAYRLLSSAEASSNLARYRMTSNAPRFGPSNAPELLVTGVAGEEVARRLRLGDALLSGEDGRLGWAREVRAAVRRAYAARFSEVDLVLGPSTPTVAFEPGDDDAAAVSDTFLVPASLAGLPAVTVPPSGAFHVGSLPVGVHLVGPAWHDDEVLAAATTVEAGV